MKNRSLAAPLILICVGVLLLLNNVLPNFSFWTTFAHFWPFLLIAYGVIRLAEVLVAAGQGNLATCRRRGGGGGLWIVIAICFVLAAADHTHRGPFWSWHFNSDLDNGRLEIFGNQFDYPINEQGSADGVTRVVLEGLRGNVTVTGGEGSSYSVEGRKTVRAYNKTEADEADRRSNLKFIRDGHQLIIQVQDGGSSDNRKVSTEIDLKVPRGVYLDVHGRSGDVTVSQLTGAIDVSTDRGDIRINEVEGNTRISAAHSSLIRVVDAKGEVELDGKGSDVQLENVKGAVTVNGSYSGPLDFKKLEGSLRFQSPQTDMRVEKVPGSLTLDLGELRGNDVVGPMRFHTKSRDVHIEEFEGEMDVDLSDRGDIDLSTSKRPEEKIDIHTRNGDIGLALPERASFDLRESTGQGEAHNDYGPVVKLEINGRSAVLKTVEGDGPRITAHADRGSVSVRKSSEAKE